jgi:uncharacterized protein (DUF488 family)
MGGAAVMMKYMGQNVKDWWKSLRIRRQNREARSQKRRMDYNNSMAHTLFTLGYSGRTPETFLANLQAAGVLSLLDIRQNPVSRKKGFSKKALEAFLQQHGIAYLHFPALGVPKPLRDRLKTGWNRQEYFKAFQTYLADCQEVLQRVLQLNRTSSCCLLCREAVPEECHRTIVAARLQELDNRLDVKHL